MISETAVQYVAAVYGITWAVAIAYIAILQSKLGRLERQLDEVIAVLERPADG
jgi:CcmD family protein